MSKTKKIVFITINFLTMLAITIYGLVFYLQASKQALEQGIDLPYEPVAITVCLLCIPVAFNIIFSSHGCKKGINISSAIGIAAVAISEMIYAGIFIKPVFYTMVIHGLYSALVTYPTLFVLLVFNNVKFSKEVK